MRKIFKLTYILLCICFVFSACSGQNTIVTPQGGQNIINMSTSAKLTTTYSRWGINFEVKDNLLYVYGEIEGDWANHIMVTFNDRDDIKAKAQVVNDYFTLNVDCNLLDNVTEIDVFAGVAEYGHFDGVVFDRVVLQRTQQGYEFAASPVYDHNKVIFEAYKNPENYLYPERDIQSDDVEIKALAQSITSGITNDYDKVKAIHKWVSENVYYDFDALRTGDYSNMDAKGVLMYKKGVCEGYSNLTAALLRSIGIPCRVQTGYALGISTTGDWDNVSINTTQSNHAWNEAYAEGRWLILDTTWDSNNEYEAGVYNQGAFTTNNYFDSTLEFFSQSHKLLN